MNAQSVISYALNPSGPGFLVYVSTGTGALMSMDSREAAEFQRQGVEVEPLCVGQGGSCMVRDGRPAVVTVAFEGKGYCGYHSPVSAPAPSAPSGGMSLVKGGERLSVRGLPVDEPRMRLMPIGVVPGLERNDLRALRVAFDVMGRGLNPSR